MTQTDAGLEAGKAKLRDQARAALGLRQWIVMQEPKAKYRAGLNIMVVVVTAKNKAAALRKVEALVNKEPDWRRPDVRELEEGTAYYI
jgi:hypothetical protein